MIKVLIVDDEPRARQVLHHQISKLAPRLMEIKHASSVDEAQHILRYFKAEIVFLDVEMPDKNGFELLLTSKKISFETIFITAFNHYAIQAIRFSALDYLLKPVDPDELAAAFNQFMFRHDSRKQSKMQYENLARYLSRKDNSDLRLAVPSSEGLFFFNVKDIIRLEADRNYTIIHQRARRPFTSSKTLKHFQKTLDQFKFMRTHKSHLVNLDHVIRISSNHDFLVMSDGTMIEVSRRKKEEAHLRLNLY
ncbi:LytR/AlgR family response regulator transcription factor [Dyadobacter arcticus]|uniref:Two-component system LytT family response regulator n=1 Tax=Dyadobacter arcticus TaxID=1078754 RepID=A0ABX0UL91_9BACT|nr:LytTR family DNA-binding domain-containing protein [Dyadobacter arcticus]NIJ52395.1 two-component system LytT family response regulator [Dyadobacter arcticus]